MTGRPTCRKCLAFLPLKRFIERISIEHKHGMRYATVKHEPRLPLWVAGPSNGLAQDGTPMSLVVPVNAFGYKWVLVFNEDHPNEMRASVFEWSFAVLRRILSSVVEDNWDLVE
ncbi:hypothetical protein BOTCAL_0832g00030 [Botryotinia calthae]|uniref:Uncharacterized protein n=1 Tax=Botryotinia calthae TaxID=38488 RepID=A0A4Y8CI90_9HELO|nr:hypothetical protein BOTCAL_0832g00030 [Botryotinia calthae]